MCVTLGMLFVLVMFKSVLHVVCEIWRCCHVQWCLFPHQGLLSTVFPSLLNSLSLPTVGKLVDCSISMQVHVDLQGLDWWF